jgi:hypothetical protein
MDTLNLVIEDSKLPPEFIGPERRTLNSSLEKISRLPIRLENGTMDQTALPLEMLHPSHALMDSPFPLELPLESTKSSGTGPTIETKTNDPLERNTSAASM